MKNLKWCAKSKFLKSRYFEIKEDPAAGFYFYVFEDDKCIFDYLQDTFEIAVEYAWDNYGIPKNAWEKFDGIFTGIRYGKRY